MKKSTILLTLGISLGTLHFLFGFAALMGSPDFNSKWNEFFGILFLFVGFFLTLPAAIIGFCSPRIGGSLLIAGGISTLLHSSFTGMSGEDMMLDILFFSGPMIVLGIGFLASSDFTRLLQSKRENVVGRDLWGTEQVALKRNLLFKSGICIGLINLILGFVYCHPAANFESAAFVLGPFSTLPASIVAFWFPLIGAIWLILGAVLSQAIFIATQSDFASLVFNFFYVVIPMLTIGIETLLLKRRSSGIRHSGNDVKPANGAKG